MSKKYKNGVVEIDAAIWDSFKAKCAINRISLKTKLAELITNYVAKDIEKNNFFTIEKKVKI